MCHIAELYHKQKTHWLVILHQCITNMCSQKIISYWQQLQNCNLVFEKTLKQYAKMQQIMSKSVRGWYTFIIKSE